MFTCAVFRCPVYSWWSEYWTEINQVFKWHSNARLLGDQTGLENLNTGLVRYSDPHYTSKLVSTPAVSEDISPVL